MSSPVRRIVQITWSSETWCLPVPWRASREALIAFRDANYLLTVLVFMAAYIAIVAFSLPGATIATLAGGFLFATFPGFLYIVVAATISA